MMYREVQRFRQIWIWLLVGLATGVAWWGFVQQIVLGKAFGNNPAPDPVMWIIWIIFGIGFPLLFYYLKLIVEVRNDGIHIRYFPIYSRTVAFKDLRSYEACRYRPIWDYGGWGIRWSSGKGWAYNVSGNRGVRLELAEGKRLLIGSQDPERLAQMIEMAMHFVGPSPHGAAPSEPGGGLGDGLGPI
jgi:hypothetical protein